MGRYKIKFYEIKFCVDFAGAPSVGMASLGAQNPGFQGKSNLVMLVMW